MAVHIGDTVRDFYFGLGAADRHYLAEKIGKYAKDNQYIRPPEGVKWSPQAGGGGENRRAFRKNARDRRHSDRLDKGLIK